MIGRRALLRTQLALVSMAVLPASLGGMARAASAPPLLSRARSSALAHGLPVDRFAIADFSLHSAHPRFLLVDAENGMIRSLRVAHGRGSDPQHSGLVRSFSDTPGSFATAAGAYKSGELYAGKHGRSMRLRGLDASNTNAMDRAIVVHSAWYAEPDVVAGTGKLGRSQGCFTVASADLSPVLEFLGTGRLLFAGMA